MKYKGSKKLEEYQKEYHRKSWQKNKPVLQARKKRYYELNKTKILARCDEYRRNHRENYRHYQKIRNYRRKQAQGNFIIQEWETLKAQYNWTCPMCGKREPEIKLTADHIIPISKGGTSNIENIQPLCRSCNASKGNHYPTQKESR
jgi:5-methylcytosine-specific restriction endonuclease McrA